MSLEVLMYSPLMEEGTEKVAGWEKETIAYVTKYKSKVYAQIRGIAKGLRKRPLQITDVDDLYQQIIEYLHRSDDYNIEKAIERSNSNTVVSLEGYLNACIKCCVQRFCTSLNKEERETIPDGYTDDDGKSLSIFDTIADEGATDSLDKIFYNLEELCHSYECCRYKYGPDIYMITYIRLRTLQDKTDTLYHQLLGVLGINKKELGAVLRKSSEDDLLTTMVRAINTTGSKKAVGILREYVFSANKIDEVIMTYT